MRADPPADGSLETAIRALREGELVVYPTDTLYGLGCLASSSTAFERLLEVKGLPAGRGVSCCFHDLDQARAWTRWTPVAEALADRFLPGPVTLILAATDACPEHLLADEGTLGVRYVDRPETLALAEVDPVVSTSANRHGEPSVHTIAEAREVFGDQVAAYVDVGALTGPASTVVDARGDQPRIIREGSLSGSKLQEAWPRG